MEWVTVVQSPLPEAMALRASLQAAGFHVILADEILQILYPFWIGGAIFDGTLQVPDFEAREVLEAIKELGNGRGTQRPPDPRVELQHLGRKVRWASISTLFFPATLIYGILFLVSVRGVRPRPAEHFLTCAAIAYSFIMVTTIASLVVEAGAIQSTLDFIFCGCWT